MDVPLYPAKAEFFKAPDHPARIRILDLLAARRIVTGPIDVEVDVDVDAGASPIVAAR